MQFKRPELSSFHFILILFRLDAATVYRIFLLSIARDMVYRSKSCLII